MFGIDDALLPIAGSVLGGIFQNDAAQTQADATRAAASTAADAANPHLQWQKDEVIPYLTNVLHQATQGSSPGEDIRKQALAAVAPLLSNLSSSALPSLFDPESRDALRARRLRDLGMNELSDRSDSPMKFAPYRDREAASQLAMNSLADPVSFLEGPYARFFDKAGEDAISRNAMAKGQGRGSALIDDLYKFGGKSAEDSFQKFINNLLTLASQRGQNFTTDESSSLQAMTAGNAQYSALIDQASKLAGEADRNVKARLGTLSDVFNFGTAGMQNPLFDKLVSIVGGQPAAAAQAIVQGNKTASDMSLDGTAALTNALGKNGLEALYNNYLKNNNNSSSVSPAPYPYSDLNPVETPAQTSTIDWENPSFNYGNSSFNNNRTGFD